MIFRQCRVFGIRVTIMILIIGCCSVQLVVVVCVQLVVVVCVQLVKYNNTIGNML